MIAWDRKAHILGKYSFSNMLKFAFSLLVLKNVHHISSLHGIWLLHRACCITYILIQSMQYKQCSVYAVIKYKVKTPTYVICKSKTISHKQISC